MTFEEAKKILEKEFAVINLHKSTEPFEFDDSNWFGYEKPSVLEAFRVLAKEGYYISISGHDYNMREKRLKKEYEENTKAPGPCEEQPKEGNPALEESASQFNDALLDEQAKKIKRLGKEITRLNKIIHKKNEELRLTKIREKNLTDVCQKYMKENEELKKKLANMVVDKIDARALKSAESALAYKEKVIAEKDEVIDKLTKENNDYKKVVEEFRNKIADMTIGKIEIQNIRLKEKNDVIADLGKELAATKKVLDEKTKLVEEVCKYSNEYREYGIEAVKMIRKMAKAIVNGGPVSSKDFKEYRRLANGYRYNPQLPDFSEEEEKKLTAKTLDFNAKCMKAARESINDVFESYAAKYAKSSLDDLKEKAYESFNAKAHKLGLVGSKDGNGLLNQMAGVDAAEEGADQSGKIVICGKDFGKILKENEESAEELSKVLNDVIDQFLLFGEIIIKSEK